MFGVAWYRLRATRARRWGGYASLVLLVALIGGIAMGSLAAGRRTQSAYPRFLAGTNASDLVVSSFGANASPSSSNAANTLSTARLRGLAHVDRVESLAVLDVAPLGPDGAPQTANLGDLALAGSVDGLLFGQDRVTVVQGRMADAGRADEFMTTADGARLLGARLGQSITFGEYTSAQTALPGFGTSRVAPHIRVDARLVGVMVVNNQVVQDDIDRYPAFVLFTPAFTRPLVADASATLFGLRLQHGSRDVAAVEQEFVRALPAATTYEFHQTSVIEDRVQRAVKPESIALGVFGAVAGLAALLIAGLALSRQLQASAPDLGVLRALGATPTVTMTDALVGLLGAVVVGSLLAVGVAVALSPLAPLGPVRPVYPDRGVAFDWTVLGAGAAVLVIGLTLTAILLAWRTAPQRLARQSRLGATAGTRGSRAAVAAGLPASGVIGVRFALEPGAGRTAVPVRSSLLGAVLAVVTVVATLTFWSGLRTLVSSPALYGWNWSYVLNPNQDVPPQTLSMLDRDPDVAGWAGAEEVEVDLDGQTVPALVGHGWDRVSPPILTGHTVNAADQIVLGAGTLAQLHKHVGDTVTFTYGSPRAAPIYIPPTRMLVVGSATMPAVGFTSFVADHTSMGTGAILSDGVIPPAFASAMLNPDSNLNGPQIVLVRLRDGVAAQAGRADIRRVAAAADKVFAADPSGQGDNVTVLGVQRPAEIVNYRSTGATPVLLAAGLAAGAVAGLGLTLAASVRRRRRDLALLKTLGFTQRQLAATVAWQASVGAVTGVVVGVPLGIALGRHLWDLFARSIDAVPAPTVPTLSVLLVALGAVIFANLVAALPGRMAARTPTALVLRIE